MENKLDLEQFEGHYPGPYIAEHGCVYYDGGNGEVAQVDLLANMTEDEYEATTRLLAAAPDLLAELKEARRKIKDALKYAEDLDLDASNLPGQLLAMFDILEGKWVPGQLEGKQ